MNITLANTMQLHARTEVELFVAAATGEFAPASAKPAVASRLNSAKL